MTTTPDLLPATESTTEFHTRGWWRKETFGDDLQRQARLQPNRLAVAARRIGQSRTDTLDYSELAETSERFAHALVGLGVNPGDVVAVQLQNRWEMVPLIFACIRVGAVICPVAPVCPEDELRHRLTLTEANVLVTAAGLPTPSAATLASSLRRDIATLDHIVVIDAHSSSTDIIDFHEQFQKPTDESDSADLDGRARSADEPFVVLFTSGTTGLSKGVVHSQNSVHSAISGYVDAFDADESWIAAVSTPLVHYSGFAQGVLASVLVGGTVVFQDLRRNELLLDLVEKYGATVLYGPPATVNEVALSQLTRQRDTHSLRHVIVGSAPVLPSLVHRVQETLGARVYSLWGLSENGPVTMTRPEDPVGWAAQSNGRPIDAMQTRLISTGADGNISQVGRLQVKGASLALGYFKRDKDFQKEIDAAGWFDTGDLAQSDGRGGIRILGRTRDAIVKDGEIAPLVELEEAIGEHPKAVEAALVGVPTGKDANGLAIVAAVVPASTYGPNVDEIRTHLLEAGYPSAFVPDRVEVLSALPKTLTGKVRKAALREQFSIIAKNPPESDR
ncbi:AMP-binding protein [Rhodococcus sp. NPDC057135]|uniref:AMP-binding protein n=1 Tax=Rhodococcus sp. NPDC057135 TaxID=3346028 RepID=UPI00362896FD